MKESARNNPISFRMVSAAFLLIALLSGITVFSGSLKRVGAKSETGSAVVTRQAQALRKTNDEIWQTVANPTSTQNDLPIARSYAFKSLNKSTLTSLLSQAPLEFTREAADKAVILTLPMPNGELANFRIEESPIMEQALADQHPEIKTYSGQGIDDPTAAAAFQAAEVARRRGRPSCYP